MVKVAEDLLISLSPTVCVLAEGIPLGWLQVWLTGALMVEVALVSDTQVQMESSSRA